MNELGPEARAILEGGRDGDDPTPADRARIHASVLRAIAAGGALGAGEAVAVAKSAGGLATSWKIILGLAAIGALGTGAVVTRRASVADSATAPAATLVAAAAPRPEPPAATATTRGEVPPAALFETSEPASPPAGTAGSPPVAAPVTMGETPKPPAQSVARAHREVGRVAEGSGAAAREASAAPASPTVAVAAPAPSAAAASPATPDTLAAETQRLREARAALKGGDPTRALSLLDEQSAAGVELREERAAARVLALCQLGRVDEARAAAARFLAESPRSPLADRVRGSCAGR